MDTAAPQVYAWCSRHDMHTGCLQREEHAIAEENGINAVAMMPVAMHRLFFTLAEAVRCAAPMSLSSIPSSRTA